MNQYPDEYSGYGHGQSGNSMQAMGFRQGNYENANMVSCSTSSVLAVVVIGLSQCVNVLICLWLTL